MKEKKTSYYYNLWKKPSTATSPSNEIQSSSSEIGHTKIWEMN
jgi:hypothetical protein